MAFRNILSKRLVIIGGKGGVGKSTVACATGLLAAREGIKTLIVTLYEPLLMARYFDVAAVGPKATALAPNLDGVWMNEDAIFNAFIERIVRIKAVFRRLKETQVYQYFAAAVPGLKELTVLDGIANLLDAADDGRGGRPYELIIVDGPATGHGVSFFEVPMAVIRGVSMGALKRMAYRIHELFTDPQRTAVVLVTLAEEMPVSETIDLRQRILACLQMRIAALVVNNFTPPPFRDREQEAQFEKLAAAVAADGAERADARLHEVIAATQFQLARWRTNAQHIEQLRQAMPVPQLYVPFIMPRADRDRAEGDILEDVIPFLLRDAQPFEASTAADEALAWLHLEHS